MSRLRFGVVSMAALVWSGAALGQTPAAAPAAPAKPAAPAAAPAAPAAAPAAAPGGPAALGVGPFWDAVRQGDAAYAARDFDGAIKGYRDAIGKEPNNPMGHYRLGEAQLAKGDQAEAEKSWQTGLRFSEKDANMRGKLLFVLADLKERQKTHDDAATRWKDYEKHAQANAGARVFPATATERQKRITEWKQISADAALVKERIEKRLKETEESMRKSSK